MTGRGLAMPLEVFGIISTCAGLLLTETGKEETRAEKTSSAWLLGLVFSPHDGGGMQTSTNMLSEDLC